MFEKEYKPIEQLEAKKVSKKINPADIVVFKDARINTRKISR